MSTEPGAGFGTVYHPEPEAVTANGPGRRSQPPRPGQLARLPRRRRPAMVLLAVALLGVGIVASAGLYQRANHQVPVVVVTAAVPAGSAITPGDLSTVTVAAGPGVQLIPGGQLGQLAGKVAATSLRPGMLLVPADMTTARPPAPGQVLVPLAVRPATLPASPLAPGDHVSIIPTAGDQGQSGSSANAAPSIRGPVAGVVEAVSTNPDQDGFAVLDVLVPAAAGGPLANQASTGQIAVIVTSRTP